MKGEELANSLSLPLAPDLYRTRRGGGFRTPRLALPARKAIRFKLVYTYITWNGWLSPADKLVWRRALPLKGRQFQFHVGM